MEDIAVVQKGCEGPWFNGNLRGPQVLRPKE